VLNISNKTAVKSFVYIFKKINLVGIHSTGEHLLRVKPVIYTNTYL